MRFNNQNILFLFSDPGGAKLILALAKENIAENHVSIGSDRFYDFYEDFGVSVEVVNINNMMRTISEKKPDLVITGTSYTSNIEQLVVQHCKIAGIEVYSIVDNWSNFTTRFTLNNKQLLPDQIFVVDEKARQNALMEEIPESILKVLPYNPYHKFLEQWTPVISRQELCRLYALDSEKEIVYYVPDPLSNVGGSKKYGFDEYSSTRELYSLYKGKNIVFKLHPNQNISIIEEFKGFDIIFVSENKYHNHFLHYSDWVVGFFSNALVEAKLLKSNPVRMLKGMRIKDTFEDKTIPVLVF